VDGDDVATMSRRESRWGWLFLSPWIAGFLAFTAGPMVFSLVLSLTHYDMLKPPRFIGLDN
jgi:multiple sugar transport system permease protein